MTQSGKQYVVQLHRKFEPSEWQTMSVKMSWNDAQDLLRAFRKDNPNSVYRVAMQVGEIGSLAVPTTEQKGDVPNENE